MENAPEDKKRRARNRAEIVTGTDKSPELLGHMLMTASETAPITHTGRSALEAVRRSTRSMERSIKPAPSKRAETLSRAELLSLSEQIVVDGSSLRQIYETHLIGERGLRRLIDEQLRDGDLKKALRREIIEREIDFERDPALRDASLPVTPAVSQDYTAKTKAGRAALDKLLEQAAADIQDSNEEAAFFKARALYEAQQLQQHRQQRRMVDVGLAVTIIILIALVTILLNRR